MLSFIVLGVIKLNVTDKPLMLIAVILIVVMLIVIMLSVVAP